MDKERRRLVQVLIPGGWLLSAGEAGTLDPRKWSREGQQALAFQLGLISGELLTACSSSARKEEQHIQERKEKFDQTLKEMGMDVIDSMQLSSGPKVVIYSDGKLNLDKSELDRAFHSSFIVLDSLYDQSEYKFALREFKRKAEEGEFRDREVLLAISSRPNTCLDRNQMINSLPRVVEIPAGKTFNEICTESAATRSVTFIIDDDGELQPIKLMVMQVTPGTVDGLAYLHPAGGKFHLTVEESVASNVGHEAIHAFLRLLGTPRFPDIEENFAQTVERELLVYFQAYPSRRPIPVKY